MKISTLGKILGVLGLVILLSTPITYFFITGSGSLTLLKAIVGFAFIVFFFATNYKNLGQFASGRSTFFLTSSALTAIALLAVLVAINYIAAKKDKTWDLTSKKIFTLAPQTQSTLKGLKEKVTAIGFLEPSNPNYEFVQNLFERYAREAPDKFEYVFKSPRKSPVLAAKYQLKEGQTTIVLTRGEGAKEVHTALSVLSEQELTNALVKINQVGEQRVYFIAGHGEWSLEASAANPEEGATGMAELKKDLMQEGYSPEALTLSGKSEIPKDAAAIVVAGGRNAFLPSEVKLIASYLNEGGRLLFLSEPNAKYGPEMEKLLADYGVKIDPGIIADDKFAVSTPYVIVSIFYADSEITRLLKQMQMNVELPMAQGLTLLKEGTLPGVAAQQVISTSPYAWEESTPDDNPQRSPGERQGQIPVVASVTRKSESTAKRFDETRIVVFGGSEILIDANWGHEANRNLVLNALGWATNEVNKITIRPPDRDVSTLDLTKATVERIRFVATDLLPLTLLGIGLAIWLTRRDK